MINKVLTPSESKVFLDKLFDTIIKKVTSDKLWTVKDIAEYTGYTESVIYRLKSMPDFPKPIMLIKQPRWEQLEVIAWYIKDIRLSKDEEEIEDGEIENAIEEELEEPEGFGILKYTKSEITTRELKRVFTRSLDRAKKYNMEHTLTLDEFFKIWEHSNGICAISGVPFSKASRYGLVK